MKILKCQVKFKIALEISQTFIPGSWQYWSNLRALLTAALLCSVLFLFKAIFSIIMSVSSGYEKLLQGLLP
jgi:hypothetical protein